MTGQSIDRACGQVAGGTSRRLLPALVFLMVLVAALPVWGRVAEAAEYEGMTFDDAIELAGSPLQLNGLGLRSLFILKAYVAGLYVPRRSNDAADLLAQGGPRRLELKMMMEMSPERLIKAFRDGIAQNHSEDEMALLRPQVEQFAEAVRAMGKARKGDTVDLDLIDGGLQLALNGQPHGRPVAEEALFTAILRMYLGPRPVDRDLKRGLLGG